MTEQREVGYRGSDASTQAASLVWGSAPDVSSASQEVRGLLEAECQPLLDDDGATWTPTRLGASEHRVAGADQATVSRVRFTSQNGGLRYHALFQVRVGTRVAALVVQTLDPVPTSEEARVLNQLTSWLALAPDMP